MSVTSIQRISRSLAPSRFGDNPFMCYSRMLAQATFAYLGPHSLPEVLPLSQLATPSRKEIEMEFVEATRLLSPERLPLEMGIERLDSGQLRVIELAA